MTDEAAFEQLISPHRKELHAHCYRMLGALHDADDALQETLLGAWRGFAGFEGRSALRTWLFQIATHACLRRIAERPRRLLAHEYAPAARPDAELPALIEGEIWVEPYPDDPGARYEELESVELGFVAALQHLPGTQRAALLLREVLGFSAAEAAAQLDTSVGAVENALQRARATLKTKVAPQSQQAALRELGDPGQRELVQRFIAAWERADVAGIVAMLASDAKFTMPPLPTWFEGQADIARFFAVRIFATAWQLRPLRASGQLGFACYMGPDFRLGAMNVLTLREREIVAVSGFLDPALHARLGLAARADR